VSSYIYGKSVSLDGSTNEPAQDGALTAELKLLSQEKGVSISTLLRSFITAAS
jgi:hypothetical protein